MVSWAGKRRLGVRRATERVTTTAVVAWKSWSGDGDSRFRVKGEGRIRSGWFID